MEPVILLDFRPLIAAVSQAISEGQMCSNVLAAIRSACEMLTMAIKWGKIGKPEDYEARMIIEKANEITS